MSVVKLCSLLLRDLDPDITYPTCMQYHYGKDYILNTQGIYYRQQFSNRSIGANRKLWTPSLDKSNSSAWEIPGLPDRNSRAKAFASHSRNNEEWAKSEYAWEADAWSDVFRPMRDDPCLAV
jgi:hypothetical protein